MLEEAKRQWERDRELAVEEERKKIAAIQKELDTTKTVSLHCNHQVPVAPQPHPHQSLAKKEEEEVQRRAELEELSQQKSELERQLVREGFSSTITEIHSGTGYDVFRLRLRMPCPPLRRAGL